jgi:hypothetical protein
LWGTIFFHSYARILEHPHKALPQKTEKTKQTTSPTMPPKRKASTQSRRVRPAPEASDITTCYCTAESFREFFAGIEHMSDFILSPFISANCEKKKETHYRTMFARLVLFAASDPKNLPNIWLSVQWMSNRPLVWDKEGRKPVPVTDLLPCTIFGFDPICTQTSKSTSDNFEFFGLIF